MNIFYTLITDFQIGNPGLNKAANLPSLTGDPFLLPLQAARGQARLFLFPPPTDPLQWQVRPGAPGYGPCRAPQSRLEASLLAAQLPVLLCGHFHFLVRLG